MGLMSIFSFFSKNKKRDVVEQVSDARLEAFEDSGVSGKKKNSFSTMPKNKKILVIASGIIVILLVAGVLRMAFNPTNKLDTEKMSNAYEAQKEVEYKAPPPPENKYPIDISKISTENNTTVGDNQNKEETITQDVSSQAQTAAMPMPERRPENMVEYLNNNKKSIEFQKKHLAFVFQQQRYLIGDDFKGWWKIEEITPNYIRFFDPQENYAYNLRFVD